VDESSAKNPGDPFIAATASTWTRSTRLWCASSLLNFWNLIEVGHYLWVLDVMALRALHLNLIPEKYMYMAVSIASKSNPPVVATQVAQSTKELTPITKPGNLASGPEAHRTVEVALPIRESMTSLIETATTLNNDLLIKDRDLATTPVDNSINDLGESELSILSAK
jgi:hypothetical protein